MLDWNKITDKLLIANKAYLTDPIVEELNLTQKEAGQYLRYLVKMVKEKRACASLPFNKCINDSFHHEMVIRDENNKLQIAWVKCPNGHKNLYFVNDYKVGKTQPFINLEAWIKDKLKEKEKNKNIVVEAIIRICKAAKNNVDSNGFYVYGGYGTGKSYLCYLLLKELNTCLYQSCAFIFVPKLLRNLKDSFENNRNYVELKMKQMIDVDVLVLDDIGAENTSKWFYSEFLFNILNERMIEEKTTIFTSNLSISQLANSIKRNAQMTSMEVGRIIERIRALVQKDVAEFTGESYRYQK